jgi:outer membrane lipoprotein-sorting protein
MRVALACLALVGCAGRIPLPKELEVSGLPELVTRMERAQSPVQRYSAEAQVTYFGKEGRARTSAVVVAARPASLRYDLQGPHGGVVSAFATDGKELQLLDVGHSRFLYGPASPATIDQVLGLGRLGLEAEELVRLFFGEVAIPSEATLTYDERTGRFVVVQQTPSLERRIEIDPRTSRPTRGIVRRGGELASEVTIDERDAHGLPHELYVRLPGERLELRIELADVEYDPELDAGVFHLDPPAGVTPEYLSPLAPLENKH